MKQCPTCNRTYPDDSLTYCLDDGSVLFTQQEPQGTQRLPSPRVTSQSPTEVFHSHQPLSPQLRQESSRWPVYLLIALLFVAIGGAVLALLSLGYKKYLDSSASTASQTSSDLNQRNASGSNGNKNSNTTTSNSNDKDSSSSDNKSPSWQLVGAWRSNVNEQGGKYELTVTFDSDGTYKFVSKDARGRKVNDDDGTWQYSNGILHQTFPNGASGKGSIAWIDNNTFELTIIDNGVPDNSGIKRRWRRIK